LLLHLHQLLNRVRLKQTNQNNSLLSKFQVLAARMHLITNNTFKVMMRMKNQEVMMKKRVRKSHPRMTKFHEEEDEEPPLLKFQQKGDQEDLSARFLARKNKATMRKMLMNLKKAQEMRIANGRTDAIFARERAAYFVAMDAHK